ncbi:MAG TPA: ABC transporter ATP-binding protein [Firmicutes bacterium]|nr:ABC transporter ATP-binding protein [Bacillota bacterium]
MERTSVSLFRFMKGRRLLYAGAVMAVGLATFFGLLTPLVIRHAIDDIIGGGKSISPPLFEKILKGTEVFFGGGLTLFRAGILFVALSFMGGLFLYLKGRWAAIVSESMARDIREELYAHIQRLPYDYHTKAQTGDLIQRATSDVETIRKFISGQCVEIGRALFMVALTLSFMLQLHRGMTLYAMAVVPLIFFFSFVFFMKVKRAFKLSDEAEGRLSTALQENVTGVRVVRAFGRQRFEEERFDRRNKEYQSLTYRLIKLLAFYWGLSDFLCLAQIGFVLFMGGVLAVRGEMTVGTLAVFVLYEGRLLWPVRQMGRILTDMGKTFVSVRRIMEILNEPQEKDRPGAKMPPVLGEICFDNVSFSYGGHPVLQNVSFHIPKGKTVALLGPTGCGKSTLVHLIAGLYECSSGMITLDGTPIDDIRRSWLRRHVGLVLQEPFLYSKSLKENIGIVHSSPREEEVHAAARDAAIHDVIMEMEKGYETAVGERGVTLSGGQKQRVAIARALISPYPILIFDDSLSAVDTQTDAAIRKALREREKRTTLIISHRITTLAQADMILVMEKGRIVQQGSHEELITREGLYQRIAGLQSELAQELSSVTRPDKEEG